MEIKHYYYYLLVNLNKSLCVEHVLYVYTSIL